MAPVSRGAMSRDVTRFPPCRMHRIWLREQLEADPLLCRRWNFPGPNPRCRSDQTLRSRKLDPIQDFESFPNRISRFTRIVYSIRFTCRLRGELGRRGFSFASARSGFPARTANVLAVCKGQSRPRQATKFRRWLIVCCRSWYARALQANVRGDADSHPFRPLGAIA